MARARSTGKFIPYDLRPAKQSERGILVDLLKIGGECGLPIRDYRYIGMGANRFYDFLMLHKYLGLRNMVSLEHDNDMFKRAQYNVPYNFIEVKNTTVAQFLADDISNAKDIFWLDYDGGIGPHISADITSMAVRLKPGDFCFVTLFGGPGGRLQKMNDADRLTTLSDTLHQLAGDVKLEDVQNANFPRAIHKILMAAFKNAFATRTDGKFVPLLQVEYSDSQPMVTVGGVLLAQEVASTYRVKLKRALPFLSTTNTELYEIRSLCLTEKERNLFDRAVTARTKRSAERNKLTTFGFKDEEFDAYKELLRYLPRYVETFI